MKFVWEHNGNDTLLYSVDNVGAYSRGESLDVAISKMKSELEAYSLWKNQTFEDDFEIEIVQEKNSNLQISDADSDILFDSEKTPLTQEEYEELKALVLKSANDFYALYLSIPDKNESCIPRRKTFYGDVPRTAQAGQYHCSDHPRQ